MCHVCVCMCRINETARVSGEGRRERPNRHSNKSSTLRITGCSVKKNHSLHARDRDTCECVAFVKQNRKYHNKKSTQHNHTKQKVTQPKHTTHSNNKKHNTTRTHNIIKQDRKPHNKTTQHNQPQQKSTQHKIHTRENHSTLHAPERNHDATDN